MKKTYINRKQLEGLEEEKKNYDKFNKGSEVANNELTKLTKKLNDVREQVNKQKK